MIPMPRKRSANPKYKTTKPKSQQYDQIVMGFDAINAFRIREGLAPIVRGHRTCMCCRSHFESEDVAHVRICDGCKNLKDINSGIKVCSFAL